STAPLTATQHSAPSAPAAPQTRSPGSANYAAAPERSDTSPHDMPSPQERPSASSPRQTGRSLSGVSINSILKGGQPKEKTAEGTPAAPKTVQTADPDSERKIIAAKEAFIAELSRNRPRFATAF